MNTDAFAAQDGEASGTELFDTQLLTQICGTFDLVGLERNARCVGNSYHSVKDGDCCRAVDDGRIAQRGANVSARSGECVRVPRGKTFREHIQQVRVGNGCITGVAIDGFELVLQPVVIAALTEQYRMTGGSVVTAIER